MLEIVFDGIDNLSGGSLQRTKEISRYGGHDGTEEKRWLANYQVEPGEATLIDSVELGIQGGGRDNADLRKALESTQLARGQRLQHSHYEETKAALIKAALAAGYPSARV